MEHKPPLQRRHRIQKRAFRAGTLIISCVAPFVLAECYFRVLPLLVENKIVKRPSFSRQAIDAKVEARIEDWWNRDRREQRNPFYPPWVIFLNTGDDDARRMQVIAKSTKFPPNTEWNVSNPFRDIRESSDTSYEIKINSLGFRGPDYSKEKPKDVFRIMAFGAYVTFGHGVNFEDSYISIMQDQLNRVRAAGDKRIEIWNLGRQGSTAIMGYSLLKSEFINYKPDLIIWDYGWAEPYTRADGYVGPGSIKKILWNPIRWFVNATCSETTFLGKHMIVCNKLREVSTQLDRPYQLSTFAAINQKMIALAEKHHVPVLLLRHAPIAIPASEFEKLEDPSRGIFFFDTTKATRTAKISKEDMDRFWSKKTWLDEIHVSRGELGTGRGPYLNGDAIQYGVIGHKVIGNAIGMRIIELLESSHFATIREEPKADSIERSELQGGLSVSGSS